MNLLRLPVLPLVLLFVSPIMLLADPSTDRKIEDAAASTYNFRTVLEKQVFVRADNGVVTLTGSVLDSEQKALAEQTVREIADVVDVRNLLQVTAPGLERSDGWIALKIRSVLLLRSNVSVKETDVSVRDGNVVLKGMADSVAQKDLTESYARAVEGVKSVTNHLTVRAPRDGAPFAAAD